MRMLTLIISLLMFLPDAVFGSGERHDPSPEIIQIENHKDDSWLKGLAKGAAVLGLGCLACYAADGCRIPFTQKIVCRGEPDKSVDDNPDRLTPENSSGGTLIDTTIRSGGR